MQNEIGDLEYELAGRSIDTAISWRRGGDFADRFLEFFRKARRY